MTIRILLLSALVCCTILSPGPASAEPLRLSFDGAWTSAPSPLLEDLPFAIGDAFSGFIDYDSSLYEQGAVSFFSLTFDGFGAVTWERDLVAPGRAWFPTFSATTLGRSTGTEVAFRISDSGSNPFGPVVESGWSGVSDLLSFEYSHPDATVDWRISSIWFGLVISDYLPSGTLPGSVANLRVLPKIQVTYRGTTQGSVSALLIGRSAEVDLASAAAPEPATFVLLLSALGVLGVVRLRRTSHP